MQAMLALNNRFHAGYKYSKGHNTSTNDCVVIEIPQKTIPWDQKLSVYCTIDQFY